MTDSVGSLHLRSFMAGVFKQIQIFSPNGTYEDAKVFYTELAIAEALYQNPPTNVGQVYDERLQALLNHPCEPAATATTDDGKSGVSTAPSQPGPLAAHVQPIAASSSGRI